MALDGIDFTVPSGSVFGLLGPNGAGKAAALVSRPPVLFLDEPTTGLDLQSRGELWQMIRELVAEGTTVLLTTQYLEEADRLAQRIAVVDRGRVIANDTP